MRMDEPDESFVKETRFWLKIIRKNRDWLAKEIGVSPNSVSSWLHSGRRIPEQHKVVVKMLMRERADLRQSLETERRKRRASSIFVEMDEETLDVVFRAAAHSGRPLSWWISDALKKYAKFYLETIRRERSEKRNIEADNDF